MEEYTKPTLKRLALKPTAALWDNCYHHGTGGGQLGYSDCYNVLNDNCLDATPGS